MLVLRWRWLLCTGTDGLPRAVGFLGCCRLKPLLSGLCVVQPAAVVAKRCLLHNDGCCTLCCSQETTLTGCMEKSSGARTSRTRWACSGLQGAARSTAVPTRCGEQEQTLPFLHGHHIKRGNGHTQTHRQERLPEQSQHRHEHSESAHSLSPRNFHLPVAGAVVQP